MVFFAFGNTRDPGIGGRMPDRKYHQWFVGCWPLADTGQEPHRIGGVGQADKPGIMDCRNQESRCDTYTFRHIVILVARAIVKNAVAFGKDN